MPFLEDRKEDKWSFYCSGKKTVSEELVLQRSTLFLRAEDAVISHGLVQRGQFLYLCSSTIFQCTGEKTVKVQDGKFFPYLARVRLTVIYC